MQVSCAKVSVPFVSIFVPSCAYVLIQWRHLIWGLLAVLFTATAASTACQWCPSGIAWKWWDPPTHSFCDWLFLGWVCVIDHCDQGDFFLYYWRYFWLYKSSSERQVLCAPVRSRAERISEILMSSNEEQSRSDQWDPYKLQWGVDQWDLFLCLVRATQWGWVWT